MKAISNGILLLLASTVKADLPVKCPKQSTSIGSTWTMHVDPNVQNLNLYQQNQLCGHNLPNRIQIIDDKYKFEIQNAQKVKVTIVSSTRVEAVDDKGVRVSGTWDDLFDQSMLVTLDNGVRYVANYRHNIKDINQAHSVRAEDKSKFNMKCDQTMVGFV